MAPQTPSLTIGMLSKACNVTAPNIRYYEKIALMPKAERNQSDQRRYTNDDVQRLNFIRRCRAFGFSTLQVRTLLSVPTKRASDCAKSRDIAQTRITDIRTKIKDLIALEKDLKTLIRSCDDTCGTGQASVCDAFTDMKLSDAPNDPPFHRDQ